MPRLKNKPPQQTKKEKKAKKREEERLEEVSQASSSQSQSQPQPIQPKPVFEIPEEFLSMIENDQEKYKFVRTALMKVKEIGDTEDDVCRQIREFHAKIGKVYASDMNAKEQKEAKALYTKLGETKKGHQEYINALITRFKTWRTEAADKAKASKELNALELLKLRHGCLPIMDVGENLAPYGTGALAWPESSRPEKGDEVAAFLEDSKTWIVAEINTSVSNHRYECIDIDDEDKKIFTLARKQLIPLPKYTCDYGKYSYMAFQPTAHVLALFPGTTCLYPAMVKEAPTEASGVYKVCFVDAEDPKKFAEPVEVSDRYIVAWRKDPKMYIRPEKRIQMAEDEDQATQVVNEKQSTDVKKRSHKKKQVSTEMVLLEVDDRDVPGPAPKPSTYYESPDENSKKQVRRNKKKEGGKVKVPKIKIRRARVPEHKKKQYNRLFGKRRKSRKPKPGVVADEGVSTSTDNIDVQSTSEKKEEKEEIVLSGDDELDSGKPDNALSRVSDESEESDQDDDDDVEERDIDSHRPVVEQDEDKDEHEDEHEGEDEDDDDDDGVDDEEQHEEGPPNGVTVRDETPQPSFPKLDESDDDRSKKDEEEEEEEELLMPEPEDIPMGYPTIQSDDSSDDSCDSDAGSYISSAKKDKPENDH